ncbi:AraC-type DNA-binding protein [Streptococcus gallolyticus]|uniref:AraC-type DNA-binding protein n=1 Tax=Streptococcus gallolyticus TaxID=315405 RepID=A0A1H7UQ32_9STRE|nr:AraC family transcriptional regulator [Streptococcus gallolyticus]SEF19084.1 AraC-type DNA-binding protein [Streptococcus gallolyticus]SEL99130.1 AraC-type DNA-binding protein [Streptococcus gallolyticus]
MNLTELEIYLHHINIFEEKQKESGQSINDIFNNTGNFEEFIDSKYKILRFPKSPFFSTNSNIFISRHNRFAPMVEHLHDFIEINYVYEGRCTQHINGKTVHLNQGDFCVLDKDVPHSIDTLQEEDILINILINEETFSSLFLYKLINTPSIQAKMLAAAFTQQTKHDKYLIFDGKESSLLNTQIQLMLCEYWSFNDDSQEFLSQYLQLILMELIRLYSDKKNKILSNTQFDYQKVLNYIDNNYRVLKLETVAKEFGYNSNYLSNMLKKTTGKNFQELLLEKRLLIACDLLTTTKLPIDVLSEEAGFNSSSYFFRQFKKHYQCTPKEYRKNKSN